MQGLAIQRTQAAEVRPPQLAASFRVIEPLNNYFFVARRLVAAALPARDPAAVVPFNGGSFHAAALLWADGDATGADANCGVGVVPATVPIIAVIAVPPDLNIDALGHLDVLGLGRSDERGSRQQRCGCRHGKSDLHHVGVLLGLELDVQRARTLRVPNGHERKDGSSAALAGRGLPLTCSASNGGAYRGNFAF